MSAATLLSVSRSQLVEYDTCHAVTLPNQQHQSVALCEARVHVILLRVETVVIPKHQGIASA